MKKNFLIAVISFLFIQINAQDDVYFDPNNNSGSSRSSSSNYEQQFDGASSNTTNTDAFRYDDGSASNRSYKNDGYTTDYDDYDYYYTSRLRRYYAPTWGRSFWDPWYTDLYFYTGNYGYWGSNIYVSVLPSWTWWQPHTRVVVYDTWGWNSWGCNSWYSPWYGYGFSNRYSPWYGGGYGWNYGYGWNSYYNGSNYWAWNNGYNQGYWNGYYDGMGYGNYYNNYYGNYGWYGKTYDMSGPRFQQTASTGSNTPPRGKSGKTDETIVKPGTETGGVGVAGKSGIMDNKVAGQTAVKSSAEPKNNMAVENAIKSTKTKEAATISNLPKDKLEVSPRSAPSNIGIEKVQPSNTSRWQTIDQNKVERSNDNRFDNIQNTTPNKTRAQPNKINETRERLNREFDAPVQRTEPQRVQPQRMEPQRAQPQRVEPQRVQPQRMEPQSVQPQRTEPQRVQPQRMEPQRVQPQRVEPQRIEPQRVQPQRFNNNQMEMRQPQRSVQPQQMERSTPAAQPRNFNMNSGGMSRYGR